MFEPREVNVVGGVVPLALGVAPFERSKWERRWRHASARVLERRRRWDNAEYDPTKKTDDESNTNASTCLSLRG